MFDRKGVMVVFFDYPVKTKDDKREYRMLIKTLKALGYVMLQKSVYIKLSRNIERPEGDFIRIKGVVGDKGNVRILPLRLSSFSKIQCISGPEFNIESFSCDIIVV